MVAQTGRQAVQLANRYTSNRVGMCLQYVRTWLDIPGGTPDAITAWRNAAHKHPVGHAKDAVNPPMGAPVFWRGGSAGHGHIALAVDEDRARSTDTTFAGGVSTQSLAWWGANWGLSYLGWTEDLNGVTIPYLTGAGASSWATGLVLVSKLHLGQRNSDSVARLCYRLMHHHRLPKGHKPPVQRRSYNRDIQHSVAYWQTKIRPTLAGPKDGTSLSNAQANAIFGPNYQVVNK